MNISRDVDFLKSEKEEFLRWISSLSRTEKLMLSLLVAVITGISAQVRIPLPWTPVPITLQVLVVLLSGALLGRTHGALSMVWYVAIGMAGLPWFAGGKPGLPIGPTSGYLIGFIPAAFFVGAFIREHKRFLEQVMIMLCAVAIIYFFGAVNFAVFCRCGLRETLTMAVLPFIAPDLFKALVAASITRAIRHT